MLESCPAECTHVWLWCPNDHPSLLWPVRDLVETGDVPTCEVCSEVLHMAPSASMTWPGSPIVHERIQQLFRLLLNARIMQDYAPCKGWHPSVAINWEWAAVKWEEELVRERETLIRFIAFNPTSRPAQHCQRVVDIITGYL